jgi:hypothetical protein
VPAESLRRIRGAALRRACAGPLRGLLPRSPRRALPRAGAGPARLRSGTTAGLLAATPACLRRASRTRRELPGTVTAALGAGPVLLAAGLILPPAGLILPSASLTSVSLLPGGVVPRLL